MIERFPRWAELRLGSLCAEVGAFCQAVDEDASGWDCLIEFPKKSYAGPADTHPPPSSAYVQVKSTRGASLQCSIKLSNALRAAQSPQPWFIVLFVDAGQKTIKVYAIHVWKELIQRTLKAARLTVNKNKLLNRKVLIISFKSTDEKGSKLLAWMQETIDGVKPEYDVAKRAINQKAGYEESHGTALMTIEASTNDEITKNFLGLGDGLRVNNFTFTPSRFCIVSPTPEFDALSGLVHITPKSIGDIEMRLRSHQSLNTIVLAGKAYAANFSGLPKEQKRFRFSAGFLEILCVPYSESECHLKFDHNEKHDLVTIDNFVTLNEWFDTGAINLQVWLEGRRITVGTLHRNDPTPPRSWQMMAACVRMLRSVPGSDGTQIKVSLNDLGVANGLKTLSDISQAGSLRVEFEPQVEAPARFTSVLYWYHVDVGEHAFYALVEREVVEDILINGKRRVTTNKHRLLETYVLTNPTEFERKMMQHDYERHLAERTQTLSLANLREFIAASATAKGSAL